MTSTLAVVADSRQALTAVRELDKWGTSRAWRGSDPYDGLNARRFTRVLGCAPIARRILTQAVKRSPVNLRSAFDIPIGMSAATLAQLASAYARNGFLDPKEAQDKLRWCIEGLWASRCAGFSEPCWGYHFDVQTRVFFYPRTSPNTIATAFAGLGLLDAYELGGNQRGLEAARDVGEFFVRNVPQTDAGDGAYFGYLPGDRTPIHNANMLVCALLARLGRLLDREDYQRAASAGTEYTVRRQRADGSWPYGEREDLGWVDGFHTGYVLDCLQTCFEAGVGGSNAEAAWTRGVDYYVHALIERDGTPRYTPAGPLSDRRSVRGASYPDAVPRRRA